MPHEDEYELALAAAVVTPAPKGSRGRIVGRAKATALIRIVNASSARNRSDDNKRLLAGGDGVGERGVGWGVGEVLFAGPF